MGSGSPGGDDEQPKRVLIADDDESTRILLAEALADETGVELVASAKDAEEAVVLVGEVEPDVAILDWSMPGGGGGGAAEEIRARHPDVAIIALTGMDPAEASYAMMSAGAVCFLQKGCTTEELLEAIRIATRW